MNVAITGATGFLGRHIVGRLAGKHRCRCWYRSTSDRGGFDEQAHSIDWVEGELANFDAQRALVNGCEAVVHAALDFPGGLSRNSREFTLELARRNLTGTLELMETARRLGVGRFIFISSCAVYAQILDDRPLDETHPLWPSSHYGAHKAAIEAFVHSYGSGEVYSICALRPSGIYGVARPVEESKWFELVQRVVRGETVRVERGGKEVHAADVAAAVDTLLTAGHVVGNAYNCSDRYISEYDVATLAKKLSGSSAKIEGGPTQPKHQIVCDKLRGLGFEFGGQKRFEETIAALVEHARSRQAVNA